MAKSSADIISGIIKSVSKSVGKEIQVVNEDKVFNTLPYIRTGINEIDTNLLEIGGFARQRISMVSGGESTGKSTVLLKAAAECQKAPGNLGDHGVVAYFDAEQTLQDEYGRKWLDIQGVNKDELICIPEIIAEEVLYTAYELCKQGVDLIIIDSIASLIARADAIEAAKPGKKAVDQLSPGFGHLAGVLALGLKQLSKCARENNVCIILINQLRDKLSTFSGWGNNDNTPGGRALKFSISVHLRLDKAGEIKEGDKKIGVMARGFVQKSKISTPLRRSGTDTPGFINIRFDGKPVDEFDSIVESAIMLKLVTKAGNTYTFGGIKAVGKEKFKAAIKENEEVKNAMIELLQSNSSVVYSEDEIAQLEDKD